MPVDSNEQFRYFYMYYCSGREYESTLHHQYLLRKFLQRPDMEEEAVDIMTCINVLHRSSNDWTTGNSKTTKLIDFNMNTVESEFSSKYEPLIYGAVPQKKDSRVETVSVIAKDSVQYKSLLYKVATKVVWIESINKTLINKRITACDPGDAEREKILSKTISMNGKKPITFQNILDRSGVSVKNIILDTPFSNSANPAKAVRVRDQLKTFIYTSYDPKELGAGSIDLVRCLEAYYLRDVYIHPFDETVTKKERDIISDLLDTFNYRKFSDSDNVYNNLAFVATTSGRDDKNFEPDVPGKLEKLYNSLEKIIDPHLHVKFKADVEEFVVTYTTELWKGISAIVNEKYPGFSTSIPPLLTEAVRQGNLIDLARVIDTTIMPYYYSQPSEEPLDERDNPRDFLRHRIYFPAINIPNIWEVWKEQVRSMVRSVIHSMNPDRSVNPLDTYGRERELATKVGTQLDKLSIRDYRFFRDFIVREFRRVFPEKVGFDFFYTRELPFDRCKDLYLTDTRVKALILNTPALRIQLDIYLVLEVNPVTNVEKPVFIDPFISKPWEELSSRKLGLVKRETKSYLSVQPILKKDKITNEDQFKYGVQTDIYANLAVKQYLLAKTEDTLNANIFDEITLDDQLKEYVEIAKYLFPRSMDTRLSKQYKDYVANSSKADTKPSSAKVSTSQKQSVKPLVAQPISNGVLTVHNKIFRFLFVCSFIEKVWMPILKSK
jgi:hypothetical protein